MKWKISSLFHASVVCELLEWLFLHLGGEPMMSFVRFSRQEQTPWRLWNLRRADEPQISIVTIAIMYVYLYTGWWFGTCFCFFPYIGNNHPNWRPHIFQRGWNHQPVSSVSLLDIRTYNGFPTSSSSEVEAFLNSPSVPREARRVKRFLASIRRWRKPTENTGGPVKRSMFSMGKWIHPPKNAFNHSKKKRNLVPSFWTLIWYT